MPHFSILYHYTRFPFTVQPLIVGSLGCISHIWNICSHAVIYNFHVN